ncbi:MAG: hypothetical protein AMK69_20290 [Nitrospira bacterium SG8_3]|nr:MAG: hypothetical protein AMK69_20290 [Nitrospira bacterium SG8_3]
MTEPDLRDIFACCALVGLSSTPTSPEHKAKMAYEIADRMLEEREGKKEGIVSIRRKKCSD